MSQPTPPIDDVTRLLDEWRRGDEDSWQELVDILYRQLRLQARSQLRRLRPGQTLGTTALVNEAYLRLEKHQGALVDRNHFYAVAATAMRQILVDHARRQIATKRGSGLKPLSIDAEGFTELTSHVEAVQSQATTLLDLHGALEELSEISPRLAQIVNYRFFAGMTDRQIAETLGITDRTVRRDWVKARAWLYQQLAEPIADDQGAQAVVSPVSKPSAKSESMR